ncbi:MAG: bacterioferritin [Agarilytica sp.]
MQASSTIIAALNKVLTAELTSINRYFLHARMFKNWGFESLNEACYKKSIKDMKQADVLIERVLFLQGLPNLQQLSPLLIGEHTEEMFACDMKFQHAQITQLKDAIALCEKEKDFVSRSLLEDILEYEEEHVDWLETQEHQIATMNLQNYLQTQIEE